MKLGSGYIRGAIATFCIVMLFATPLSLSGVQRAEALSLGNLLGGVTGQRVTVVADTSTVGITNVLKNTLSEISAAISAGVDTLMKLKEMTLDGIAWSVAQNAINRMTADMINWVTGGFNGEPAFINDLEGFLQETMDEAVGAFLLGSEFQALCEPYRIKVPSALIVQYTSTTRTQSAAATQCVFDDIPGADLEEYLKGDFSKGGWSAFFELTIGGNDPIATYLDKKNEQYVIAIEEQQRQLAKAEWSRGYRTPQDCEYIEDATGGSVQKCVDKTPGSLIETSASFQIGVAPTLKLIEADEIDEMIGTFAQNIMNQALRGTFGLLGLGGNTRYTDSRYGDGTQTFTDALRNDQASVKPLVSNSELVSAISTNTEYRDLQQDILDEIDDLEERLEEGEEDAPACFDLTLSDDLETDKDNATTNHSVAAQVLTVLEQMKTLSENGTIDQQNAVYQQYLRVMSEGLVKSQYDVTKLRTEFVELEFANRVAAFKDEIEDEENRCN